MRKTVGMCESVDYHLNNESQDSLHLAPEGPPFMSELHSIIIAVVSLSDYPGKDVEGEDELSRCFFIQIASDALDIVQEERIPFDP